MQAIETVFDYKEFSTEEEFNNAIELARSKSVGYGDEIKDKFNIHVYKPLIPEQSIMFMLPSMFNFDDVVKMWDYLNKFWGGEYQEFSYIEKNKNRVEKGLKLLA